MPNNKKKTVILSSLVTSVLALAAGGQVHAMGGGMGGGCASGLISVTALASDLDFTQIEPCAGTAGSVSINPGTGARTTAGCISTVLGTHTRGRFRVRANQTKNNRRVHVQIPGSAVINSGGNKMTVTGLSLSPGGGTTDTILGKATETYFVGGTDNVAASQAAGTYTGALTVTATCL